MENYKLLFENQIKNIIKLEKKPCLLLHSCCAPCSSYVLEALQNIFEITLFFYNPNIYPEDEYNKRFEELEKLLSLTDKSKTVNVIKADYNANEFFDIAKGLENEPERGERCTKCYILRLFKTAEEAAKHGFDYFTTTLSISPHKDAERLNKTGMDAEKKSGVKYLFSDFKKNNGYKRSIELSREYGLYRQNYCGCVYSRNEAILSGRGAVK